MTTPLTNQLMRATLARFEADRFDALATFQLYLNAPAAVGDHPDIVGQLVKAAAKLASAEDALEALNRNFLHPVDAEEEAND